ncbi:MAG TPA: adenylate/guanylate cyclase domain-containing protein [Burkholderiales bacterium]|nr:adenylate/guanylate cyclase domain-containing protein [Burkholderiales bacterium]
MPTCPNCRARADEGQKFCGNCGFALDPAPPIAGERKFATFLFADVAHSTSIAERLDPEDWTSIMNGAFGFMNAAVAKYGGTVSRLMGDAVLALFGAPVAHEDDADRAVRAGLEIQDAARAYAREVKQRHGVDFDLRVGINTGIAVLAVVGDAIRNEYTAMGDAANLAARLQSAADPGTVLISADTHRLVVSLFDFKPRGRIEMKGKQAPVESFEVLGLRAVPGKARGIEGLASSLVGRERELGLLRDRLAALLQGAGSVVVITGEAGLGKSRLVAELRALRDAQPDARITWYESRAISYGQSMPYHPWRQLGRQIVGASDMDEAPAVRQKLSDYVARSRLPAGNLAYYETLLAVDTEESRTALSRVARIDVANGVAGAVIGAIRAAIHSADGIRPHALVLDDLHWSDSATLELIAQVATLASVEPLLMVCVMRPDRGAASWSLVDRLQASLGSSFARIDLEPLDSAQAGALLGNLLPIDDLPAPVKARIIERSDGNPFYLEEVLRSLIDCGQVVRDGGRWRATREIVDANIPETLAGVLSARIDHLPETTKRVAQTAAVIGRVFMHRVLETVCHAAPPSERVEHIEPHIGTLSMEQIVRERARNPEREYSFKHAMTCEAAYGLLLRARRRELHERTGVALETLFAERRDEFAPMLAHHFAEADDLKRALDYSRRAAASALKLYALREELGHRDRVLALLGRMPDAPTAEVVDAIFDWVVVRHRLNQYDGVLDRLADAVARSRAADDKHRLARALSWTGNIYLVTGYPSRSFPYIEESRKLATEVGDEQLMLLPLFVTTWWLIDRDPAAAPKALEEVIALAEKQQAYDILGHAIVFRAIAQARLGNFSAARADIAKALQIAPRAGSPVKEADIHIGVSEVYYTMGEVEKGLEHARIGADMAFSAKGFECACAGHFSVGNGQFEQQRLDEAASQYAKSLEIGDQVNSPGFSGYINQIRASAARVEFERGSPAALESLRIALSNARSSQDEFGAATISKHLASALIKLGRNDEAAPLLESVIEYFRRLGMRPYLAGALELAATMYEQSGRPQKSDESRSEAARLRDLLGMGSAASVAQA